MIVVDASAVADLLLGTPRARAVDAVLRARPDEPLIAPGLMAVEVMRVMRRAHLRGAIGADRARAALDDLHDLGVAWFTATPLLARAWELRENITIDDGLYVALAEGSDAALLTTDARLASAVRTHTTLGVLP